MTAFAVHVTPERRARRAALLNYFSLFSSFGTLICCVLPSVLVLLGLGTTVASLLSTAPWLVSFSKHKLWTFSISGTLIAASFAMTYWIAPRLRQDETCAADDPTTCGEVSRLSRVVLWGSALVWSAASSSHIYSGPFLSAWIARQRWIANENPLLGAIYLEDYGRVASDDLCSGLLTFASGFESVYPQNPPQ